MSSSTNRNTILSLAALFMLAIGAVGGLAVWMNRTHAQRHNGDWCIRFSRDQLPEERVGAACDAE